MIFRYNMAARTSIWGLDSESVAEKKKTRLKKIQRAVMFLAVSGGFMIMASSVHDIYDVV